MFLWFMGGEIICMALRLLILVQIYALSELLRTVKKILKKNIENIKNYPDPNSSTSNFKPKKIHAIEKIKSLGGKWGNRNYL